METYFFDNVEHALKWATEILRYKRFPYMNPIYREILSKPSVCSEEDKKWIGHYGLIPTDSQEKYHLAIRVYQLLGLIKQEEKSLLMLKYWGDYHSEEHLKNVQTKQHKLRIEGKRTRLNYRYSFRQLGELCKVNHKTAKRYVDIAMNNFEDALRNANLLE